MEPFHLEEQQYFYIKQWMEQFPDLVVGFTTKNGGVSEAPFSSLNLGFHVNDLNEAVKYNREILAEKLAFPLANWVGAEQTHETTIAAVRSEDKGKGANSYDASFKSTDGFITFGQGTLLTLGFADCVPLFFIHPKSKAIAIAHAGWKGTVKGIARSMINRFASYQLDARDIHVVIGPSICENCYVVDKHVIEKVKNILVHVEKKPYNLIREDQYKLDLKRVNELILIQSGVPKDNIVSTKLCTSCDNQFFFSHRRDRQFTGRMLSFMGWKEGVHE